MPDVGVLQLSIQDNSKNATKGLDTLVDALGRVRKAVENGLNLSSVNNELKTFATTVNRQTTTTTVIKNLTAFGNAMDKLSRISKAIKFDPKPLSELKAAIGDGISLKGNPAGQIERLKTALTGDWGDGSGITAMSSIKSRADAFGDGDTANKLKAVADSVRSYVDAAKKLQAIKSDSAGTPIAESIEAIGNAIEQATANDRFKNIGLNIAVGIRDGIIEGKSGVINAAIEMARGVVDGVNTELDIHSPSRKLKKSGIESAEGYKQGWLEKESEIRQVGADVVKGVLEDIKSVTSQYSQTGLFSGADPFEQVEHSIRRLNDVDAVEKVSKSIKIMKGEAIDGTAKLDLLRSKFEILEADVGRMMVYLMKAGENPLQNLDLVNMMLQVQGLNEQIEKMTELNEKATKSKIGMDAVTSALDADKIDNMVTRYHAMIKAAAKGYDEGRMSEEKFASAILRIQEYGDKIKKAGGEIDENANEATKAINRLFDALDRKVDYSYLSSVVDVITGAARKGMSAEEWGIDAFVNDATKKIGGLIEMLERPINYSNFREAIDFTMGIGKSKMSAEDWGIDVFANEVSNQIEALMNMLDRPINYSGLGEFIDFMQGIGTRRLSAEEWGIGAFVTEATKQINALIATLEKPIDYSNLSNFVDYMQGIGKVRMSAEDWGVDAFVTETSQKIGSMIEYLERPIDYSHLNDTIDHMLGIGDATKSAEDSFKVFLSLVDDGSESAKRLSYENPELIDLKRQMNDAGISAQSFNEKLIDLDGELKSKKKDAGDASEAFKNFKDQVKSAFPVVSKWIKKIGSTIRNRTIRYVLRALVSSIKEGIQNVYYYSKEIGSSFAPAMDSAASSIKQLKNSVGAALAPVVQALIPVLNNLVNWFINLINAANQFFSLLNGQTAWTRAVPQTAQAFKDQEKATKGAAAAMKDLLADWDELNIIQSNTGGGTGASGATAAEDYLNMFEEVYRFDKDVRNVVDFIKDNFETIKDLVEGIGAAILLWKVSKAFGETLGFLQSLELAAGLTLMISGIKLATEAGYDIGKNGINNDNLLQAVGGVLETALGTALVGVAFGGIIGGAIGLVAGALLGLTILHANIERGHLDSLYGDLHKDVGDIIGELEGGILTPEAKLKIDVINAALKSQKEAETKVENAVKDLEKTYPVNVKIAPDKAEDFKSKVDTLVTETNALIEQSKETMKLYVPATAAFTENFVQEAWDGVSEYVTLLGKKIGEELDKSITDNTKLDDLREKLLNISKAVLTATRSSEIVGRIGVLGAETRNNSTLGRYDREAVSTYITEYNSYIAEKMGEASAYAQAEYTEKNRLVAGLEETIAGYEDLLENGTLTEAEIAQYTGKLEKAKQDLEIAKAELLASFGVNGENIAKKAQEYFDEWSATGREVFAQDIIQALSIAMSNNKGFGGNRQATLMGAVDPGRKLDTDEWADEWIQKQLLMLRSTIAQESGMTNEQIQQFLDVTGVNPLAFFDEGFIKEYQEKVKSWLGTSGLSDERKKKIADMLGFSIEELEKAEKEVEKVTYSKPVNGEIDPVVETTEKARQLYNEIWRTLLNQDIEGAGFYNLPETLRKNKDVEALEKLRDLINELGINSGYTEFNEWYKEYNPAGYGNTSGKYAPIATIASSGMAISGGWNEGNDTTPPEAETIDYDRMESSMVRANENQNDLIRQAIDLLVRIANKDNTVVVTPSSGLGQVVNRSTEKYRSVTGW